MIIPAIRRVFLKEDVSSQNDLVSQSILIFPKKERFLSSSKEKRKEQQQKAFPGKPRKDDLIGKTIFSICFTCSI